MAAKLNSVLVLMAATLAAVQGSESGIDAAPPARFLAITKTSAVIPTVTQTIYQPSTCIVVPASVTATCSVSTTNVSPTTTVTQTQTQTATVTQVVSSSGNAAAGAGGGPLIDVTASLNAPGFLSGFTLPQPPQVTVSGSVSGALTKTKTNLLFADNVHARHLRFQEVQPSMVESVETTDVPTIEDISFRALNPELESSQQDVAELEIYGLPDSCAGNRGLLNLLTVVNVVNTGDAVTSTFLAPYPASATNNRVSLTIGGCLPNPPLAYQTC